MCTSARRNPHVTVCPHRALTEPSSEGQDSEGAAEGVPFQELHFLFVSKRPWDGKMSKDVLTDFPPDLA